MSGKMLYVYVMPILAFRKVFGRVCLKNMELPERQIFFLKGILLDGGSSKLQISVFEPAFVEDRSSEKNFLVAFATGFH
jgi:hypothetical protein